MSFIEIDRGLLISTAIGASAALVLLRWAEGRARRIATERVRDLLTSIDTGSRG